MKQYRFDLPWFEPDVAFSAFADDHGAVFFDSSDRGSRHSEYSYICIEPVDLITGFDENPFPQLKRRLANAAKDLELIADAPVPFTGGVAGFFSYDLGRTLEHIPSMAVDEIQSPDMILGVYHQVIAYDLKRRKSYFFMTSPTYMQAELRYQEIIQLIKAAPRRAANPPVSSWRHRTSEYDFKQDIGRVISYIRAGDIFQANLAQRFDADRPDGFDTYAHYQQLRAVNPAPYSAYVNLGGLVIASSSPERFLQVSGRQIETCPIKGTASSAMNPSDLQASAKNRAENIMIVDLLRNDLSKVCTPDSIDVPELCEVETYRNLHHLVSRVTGTLQDGKTGIDALAACFPGGSITGAPKIRAMEIIEELEPMRRGPYCGSIGYIGFNGVMDTNIAIRTVVYYDDIITFSAGGGIVADSDVEAEYHESLIKAQRIFDSFTGVPEEKVA